MRSWMFPSVGSTKYVLLIDIVDPPDTELLQQCKIQTQWEFIKIDCFNQRI